MSNPRPHNSIVSFVAARPDYDISIVLVLVLGLLVLVLPRTLGGPTL